nr:uncharacterized protein DDB_G0287625 isoform X2 [Ipomoea batatas]
MSGNLNKRPHEEGGDGSGSGNHGHSSAPKYIHDDSNSYAKVMSSATHEYHSSYDAGQDVRMPKIPRTESRDVDRRSPLLPTFRVSSSLNDLHSDHTVGLEARLEAREGKDSIREVKAENREAKAESRELYQGGKGDKDARTDSRVDDSKETKHERDSYSEYKVNMKSDKDSFSGVSNHLNWKDSKEQNRGKRYPDVSGGNMDPWHASRTNVHVSAEVPKESVNVENRDYVEACEAVGENRGRTLEQETEKKKQKDHDGWKSGERESRDKRKERDQDVEGERNEKCNKYNDNDLEEVGMSADGGGDREREGFNYGVQQRKRMLRPRGSPQMGNRDPRFRSRVHDNEGYVYPD